MPRMENGRCCPNRLQSAAVETGRHAHSVSHSGLWATISALALPSLFRIAGVPVVQTWHGYDSRRMGLRWIPNSALTGGLIFVRPEYIDMMSPLYRWLNRRKHLKYIPNSHSNQTHCGNERLKDL
jgi:hypothetical protein